VHHADAGRSASSGPPKVTVSPSSVMTAVRPVHAREDLHQRCLAGAVLPEERVHAAGFEVEGGAVQRAYPGKDLD
jgi:hypothetical protein